VKCSRENNYFLKYLLATINFVTDLIEQQVKVLKAQNLTDCQRAAADVNLPKLLRLKAAAPQ